eukprot:402440-Heterocapsa_arctica.AAC.1
MDVCNYDCGGHLELSIDRCRIRAKYGHSLKISDEVYERVEEDDMTAEWFVHGTTDGAWQSIKTEGLRGMGRQHVHLAQRSDRAQVGSNIHIYVN